MIYIYIYIYIVCSLCPGGQDRSEVDSYGAFNNRKGKNPTILSPGMGK